MNICFFINLAYADSAITPRTLFVWRAEAKKKGKEMEKLQERLEMAEAQLRAEQSRQGGWRRR